jgi:predicted nucleic acid-binding Zn ribbon protein
MSSSEFDEPSSFAQWSHCGTCFQALSPMKVWCQRCGKIDNRRVGKACTELLLGTTAVLVAIGIVFLAVMSQRA